MRPRASASLAAILVVLFAIGLVPATGLADDSAPALTNADIVKLSSLGLGDEVVIAKINQAPKVAFALEVADIEKLQQGGVSKSVIAAMLQRATSSAVEIQPVASTVQVWAVTDGKPTEIPSVAGYVEASLGHAVKQAFLLSFKNKMAITARGTTAKTRFPTPPLSIFTRYRPSEIGIARLTVQPEKDRRYIWVVSRVGSNSGEFQPPEDDVKFTDETMKDGSYKLTFKTPLTPGEYGLIAADGKTGYVVHDFSVGGN